MTSGSIQARPYAGSADFERVRQFLFDTYRSTRSGLNWEVRRWEGHFHEPDLAANGEATTRWAREVRLWETQDGTLVGVAHPEDGDDAWLEVHPAYRHLEDEMYAWAEPVLAKTSGAGQQHVHAFQIEGDSVRAAVLKRRDYKQTEWWAVNRWRDMRAPVPALVVADGYTVRAVRPGDAADLRRVVDVINAGFNAHHTVEEYVAFEKTPSYRADLHIVAEAPDGSFAAFSGVTYSPEIGLGVFEPVCTAPDHRRKGLARACMVEGLRRLAALGAARACVGTGGSNPSNVLYEGIGFSEVERVNIWRKAW